VSRNPEDGGGFPKGAIEGSIPARFEAQVRCHPDRPALRCGDRELSYAELDAKANGLARAIAAGGGAGSEPILVLLGHGPDEIAALLAVSKAGKAYVALDPAFPRERLRAIADDAGAGLVLTRAPHLPLAASLAPAVLDVDASCDAPGHRSFALPISADALAAIVYTSGSTGRPKGVARSHRCVLHRIWLSSDEIRVCPRDRLSHMFSCSFVAAEVDVFTALLNGATLCLYPTPRLGIAPLADWLRRAAISVLHPPPTLFRRFLEYLESPLTLPDLRLIALAGEPISRGDVERIRERLSADCVVLHRFSSTETSVVARFRVDPETPLDDGVIPVGRAVPDKQVALLDASGREVAPGEVGEIAVRSRFLAAGYWRQPDLTREKFALMDDGETRLFRTGDLGRWRADGSLVHLGRADRQVKIRGYRVEPGEIENALLAIPSVREAAVCAEPDARGEARLVAYLAPARGAPLGVTELRRRLGERLPHTMLPAEFVVRDELPTTPTGKLDRRALRASDFPDGAPPPGESLVPARDGIEFQLQMIWEEVLGHPEPGVTDDFFELGGDSIRAAELVAKIEAAMGRALDLAAFLETPTIAATTRRLREKECVSSFRFLVPLQIRGAAPPFYCVHPATGNVLHFVNLARHLAPEQPFYGLQARGLEGREPYHDRIEQMAADYLAEVRRHQPAGPYFLGGRCVIGGLVATEMARQILAGGERVALLALFDPVLAPRLARDGSGPADRLREWRRRVRLGAWRRTSRLRRRWRGARSHGDFREDVTAHWMRLWKLQRVAPYPGGITLFCSDDDEVPEEGSWEVQLRRWSEVARGPVDVERVPGNHRTVLREPNVGVVAERLKVRLRAARDAAGSPPFAAAPERSQPSKP
jgi:amino acid adenylation domain-containing protein